MQERRWNVMSSLRSLPEEFPGTQYQQAVSRKNGIHIRAGAQLLAREPIFTLCGYIV